MVGWDSTGLHSVSGTMRLTFDTDMESRKAKYTEKKIPAYRHKREERDRGDTYRRGECPAFIAYLLTDNQSN